MDNKKILKELEEITKECAKPNWDGYGANSINIDSVHLAERFIWAFWAFDEITTPELACEPDGCIEMEWFGSVKNMIGVTFQPNDMISYAGRY